VEVADAEEEFKIIDQSASGAGGQILFDEFCHWALRKGLDYDKDMPDDTEADGTNPEELDVLMKVAPKSTKKKKKNKKRTYTDFSAYIDKLPAGRSQEASRKRRKLFKDMDQSSNGLLSLAEIELGMNSYVGEEIFLMKPALKMAYKMARTSEGDKNDIDSSFVDEKEFFSLIQNVRRYIELYAAFADIDSSRDHRIELKEFKQALPMLRDWGVAVTDAQQTFSEIDQNGGGFVLFDEFCEWALQQCLDYDKNFGEEEVDGLPPPITKSSSKQSKKAEATVSISLSGDFKDIVRDKKAFIAQCNAVFEPVRCFDVRNNFTAVFGSIVLDISGKPDEIRNTIVAIQQMGLLLNDVHIRELLSVDVIEYEHDDSSPEINDFFADISRYVSAGGLGDASASGFDSDDEDGITSTDGVTSSIVDDPCFKFPASTLPLSKKTIIEHTLSEFFTDMDVNKSKSVTKEDVKRIFSDVLDFGKVDLDSAIEESWDSCKAIYEGAGLESISRKEFNRLSISIRRYFEISKAYHFLSEDTQLNKQGFLMLSTIFTKWDMHMQSGSDEFYMLTSGFDLLDFAAFRRWAMTFALLNSSSPRMYIE